MISVEINKMYIQRERIRLMIKAKKLSKERSLARYDFIKADECKSDISKLRKADTKLKTLINKKSYHFIF